MKILAQYKLFFFIILFPCLLYGQKKTKTPPPPPPPPPNYLKTGDDYYSKENYKQALESYNQFLKDSMETATLSFGLGRTYLKLGEFEKGMSYLNKAARKDERFNEYLLNLDYNDIPISVFRLNSMSDKLIRKISNGIRVSPVYFSSQVVSGVTDKITLLPVWNASAPVSGYGAEVSFYYNPLSVSLAYMSGQGDMTNLATKIALPPSIPGQAASILNTNIQVTSISGTIAWTPAVVLWGYVYPFCGASFLINQYTNKISKSYSIICLDAGAMIKYKDMFIKGSLMQPLDNSVFENQAQLQAGVLFNLVN
ncbi:MAG: tetratricopeptide repeat protein [Ignavibacteria bacterium]